MTYTPYARGAHTGDPEKDLAIEQARNGGGVEIDLPDEVLQYLLYFKKAIQEGNIPEIQMCYEHGFGDITERFFMDSAGGIYHWPNEQVVQQIVGADNRLFVILYKELYFRDVYTRMARGPALAHRYDSYMNYQELFSEILNQSEQTPVDLQMPNLWLWDIIDEFVYQFQSFCLYKANPTKRTPDEIDDLVEIEQTQNAWNLYPVLNILYSLLDKSQINQQLEAIREGKNPDDVADEFGRSALYFKLGYFSLVGLLRTHVLLGDYHQALQTVKFIDMDDPKGLCNTVPSCLVTLHYFVGFSHMMMRNYGEATKIFINCLLYVQHTHHGSSSYVSPGQPQKRNTKYDVIGKTTEQIYHLLAICLTIQPQRIDDSVQIQLQERSGDRMLRMANGDIDEFKTAFQQGCPKFLSPTTVAYEGANLSKIPLIHQCHVFLEGIGNQICIPVLRGYLKLYTSIPLKKLAGFTRPKALHNRKITGQITDSEVDALVGKLLTFKVVVNELGKETIEHCETEDTTADLDFYIDKDMITVADTKVVRQVSEYFVKSISKLRQLRKTLKQSMRKPA